MSRALTVGQRALAAQVLELNAKGWRGRRIASHLGTSPAMVSRILSRVRVEVWLREAHDQMMRLKPGHQRGAQVLPGPFPPSPESR